MARRHFGCVLGRLQDRVAQHPRYARRAAGQYRAVSDEEFRTRCPTRPTQLGKLDIMAQEAEFVLVTGLLGPAACQEHRRVRCPRAILQRANASTIYTCVGTALSSATLGVARLTQRRLEAERPQRPGEGFSEPLVVA